MHTYTYGGYNLDPITQCWFALNDLCCWWAITLQQTFLKSSNYDYLEAIVLGVNPSDSRIPNWFENKNPSPGPRVINLGSMLKWSMNSNLTNEIYVILWRQFSLANLEFILHSSILHNCITFGLGCSGDLFCTRDECNVQDRPNCWNVDFCMPARINLLLCGLHRSQHVQTSPLYKMLYWTDFGEIE